MKVYFADASSNRGQLLLLAQEHSTNSLFSYGYISRKESLFDFQGYWNELVKIHLASNPTGNSGIQAKTLVADPFSDHLLSYEYRKEEQGFKEVWDENMRIHLAGHSATLDMEKAVKPEHENHLATFADPNEVMNTTADSCGSIHDLRPRVIIDSGAFTAWSTGKPIKPQDYAEWALDFDKRWRHKMAMLEFMNLDVIGDQDATWKNLAILEGLGMKPLPIVTFGVDLSHVDRALKNYDYIALGGLVPHTRNKPKLKAWLDRCFSRAMKYRKETGIMRRIHLLGITTDWVLKRYPAYSSDSSSWVSCLRFGGGAAAGIKQLPRYKESAGALAATIHTLRSEIRKYKTMEQEATSLWKARGIFWDD